MILLRSLTGAVAVAIALSLPACSWLKTSSEPPPAPTSRAAEDTEDDTAAPPGKAESSAENVMGSRRKKIPAARVEQLTKDQPDYSFCRGVRCPARSPKQVVYSNAPDVQLKGITQPGEVTAALTARATPGPIERRSLTAVAFGSDGTLEKAAQEQITALGKKHAANKFQVIYMIPPNSTPQDELKATKRGVELERALIAGGVAKSRIELRAERAEAGASGRAAEVLVLPAQ